MIRLLIHLNEIEAETLASWAALEMRNPNDQVHFIIRQELLRRGLLPDPTPQPLSAAPKNQTQLKTEPDEAG